MARKVGSHGNAKREHISNAGDSKSLTKHNLERFTEVTRRQEAQRRGQSTPSPEPNYRGRDDSTLSSRVKARRAPEKATFTSSRLVEEDRITHQVADLFARINSKPPSGARPRRSSSLPTETDSGTQKATRLGEGAGKGGKFSDTKKAVARGTPAGAAPSSQAQETIDNSADARQMETGAREAGVTDTPWTAASQSGVGINATSSSHPGQLVANKLSDDVFQHIPCDHGNPRWSGLEARRPEANPSEAETRTTAGEPRFPPNFPAYRATRTLNEAAAYLANASYFVSVGGPPLDDLKSGIIAVPAGKEAALFGRQPDHVVSQAFLDAVADARRGYSKVLRMHNPDRDSDEFVRRRFDDSKISDPSLESFRGVELTPLRWEEHSVGPPEDDDHKEEEEEGEEEERESQEISDASQKTASPARRSRASRGGKRVTTSGAAAAKPWGVAKTRSSPCNLQIARATRASTHSAAFKALSLTVRPQ